MSVFYKKLLNKIKNDRPADVSSFIESNSLDVVQTLEKIAIIPINYTTKIDLKDEACSVKQENDVNLRYFPSIYTAVLNEEHSLEMVMWLHKHTATSITRGLIDYTVDRSNGYYEEFLKAQENANFDYITHAITNDKPLLLNYLLSFISVQENAFEDFDGFIVDLKVQKESDFKQQKLLFESKNYEALMGAIENSTLVYSVLELAKDDAFVKFFQANGSDFVKLYMDNAKYELGFSKDGERKVKVDDPKVKFKCRRPIVSHTTTQKTPLKANSMFDLSSMASVAGGVAVAGLAAYYLSSMRK